MNTTKILASTVIAMASALAGNAFAQAPDHAYTDTMTTPSTLTRAQVQSELAQAKQNGRALTDTTDHGYANFAVMNKSAGKTRAEVQAELRMQAKNGSTVPYDHS